jgi:hypothetical protein
LARAPALIAFFKKKYPKVFMAPTLSREQVSSAQLDGDFAIKSESITPKLETSDWPLLLKNYDKLLVRSSHFTPLTEGCSPLKRDITSYIKYGAQPSPIFIVNTFFSGLV